MDQWSNGLCDRSHMGYLGCERMGDKTKVVETRAVVEKDVVTAFSYLRIGSSQDV